MEKIALITGGSRGIGAATARMAAANGYAVAVNYVANAEAAQALVSEIEAGGGRAIAVQADVASEDDIVRMFATVDADLGPLTALVNNAGILESYARVEDMDGERLSRTFAVNVTGAFLCAREAIKRMSTKHGGRGGVIVNLSSAAARIGSGGLFVDYAASKGAINTMTVGLANEVVQEGIRVNAVSPGLIDTGIHAAYGDPGRVGRLAGTVPMGRGGTPEEVAEAILWLMSEASSYVTGTALEVTGGR